MSISVVNGYVCTSCNDIAKAKKGENPHPPPGSDGKDGTSGASGASPFDGPAVTFGGSLSALLANAADPAAASQQSDQVSQRTATNAVDLLA